MTRPTAFRLLSNLVLLTLLSTWPAVGRAAEPTTAPAATAPAAAQIDYGRPHPDAPPELEQFAFLVGSWTCSGRRLADDGIWEPLTATLVGRYILDGYVIEDVYRQVGPLGNLVHFGATYRSYDPERGTWVMKFHDALGSSWLDLGPPDLGGVTVADGKITFQHHILPGDRLRVTFSDIEEDQFVWRGEISGDGGNTWTEVMVMEASRVEP